MNELWTDPAIPAQQLAVVKRELEQVAEGKFVTPYAQFFECLDRVPDPLGILDVGAGCGHYGEAMRLTGRGLWRYYTAIDASATFRMVALAQFPWMSYDVGMASYLPYRASAFSVVLSSACLMYAADPMNDIRELARVSSGYVILHRTPIDLGGKTHQIEQTAYGQTFLETRFAEADLMAMFEAAGLSVCHVETIFETQDGRAHRSYLLKKEPVFPVTV